MTYRTLRSLFHEQGRAAALAEQARRLAQPGTMRWEFPLGQGPCGEGPLFVLSTPTIGELCASIRRQEQALGQQWHRLSVGEQQRLHRHLAVAEVHATSAVEGITHARDDLERALGRMDREGSGAGIACAGMLWEYLLLGAGEQPRTLGELRGLYDRAIAAEINPEDAPDGVLFRHGPVVVGDGADNDRTHRGFGSEEAVCEGLQVVLAAMHSQEESPQRRLLAPLMAHVMLELVHPFYDGNGRVGRLLLARGIATELSVPTALCLSTVILESRAQYYRAFRDLQHPLSFGDGTGSALILLRCVDRAQQLLGKHLAKWDW